MGARRRRCRRLLLLPRLRTRTERGIHCPLPLIPLLPALAFQRDMLALLELSRVSRLPWRSRQKRWLPRIPAFRQRDQARAAREESRQAATPAEARNMRDRKPSPAQVRVRLRHPLQSLAVLPPVEGRRTGGGASGREASSTQEGGAVICRSSRDKGGRSGKGHTER